MIRMEWGNQTATSLLLRNRDVHFKSYPNVDHEICDEEVKAMFSLLFCLLKWCMMLISSR